MKAIIKQYRELYKKSSDIEKEAIYKTLKDNKLLTIDTAKKETILHLDTFFAPYFEKYHNNKTKNRYVDFNQGLDARLLTADKMKKLSEIPIYPLRIAFDSWNLRDTYEKAVRLAAKNGIKNLSNYLLYNYNEKPIDLYNRLKLNIDLCEELNISIYSFPMKYHPIKDPKYFRNRTYLGIHWNRKFIRSIQAILNSTKGKVGRGKSFFEEAFGRNKYEFEKLLYMPEAMIIYRFYYKNSGATEAWWNDFNSLSEDRKDILKKIIHDNNFKDIYSLSNDNEILKVLKYYTITRDETEVLMKKSA